MPLRETRKLATVFEEAIAALPTRNVRRALREASQGTEVECDLAPAIRRLARRELAKRDRRRRQQVLPL
jgi:hypothetical protein